MPQITNTFLKSKMNKDLDSRILPNGEYRDAQNLQISRSQGSEVGEFENISGNTELRNLYTGESSKFIGQFTNETSGDIFLYSSGFTEDSICPRDTVVYFGGFVGGSSDTFTIENSLGTQIDPSVLGIEIGMLLWGDSWGPSGLPSGDNGFENDVLVENITSFPSGEIQVNGPLPASLQVGDEIYIGYNNTIHRYNPISDSLDLLVRGDFLNFSQKNKITGINLIDDLLFWTDNRNQPRKINVSLANPQSLPSPTHYVNEDQISVAKYYPYRTPLVLEDVVRSANGGAQAVSPLKGYVLNIVDTSGIKIGDIATGFPDQGDQELWNVISIELNVSVTIYNNFKDGDFAAGMSPGTFDGATQKALVSFKRPSSKNLANKRQTNGFETTASAAGAVVAGNDIVLNYSYFNKVDDQSAQPTPRVGDFIISETLTGPSGVGITIADEVVIQSIQDIGPSSVPITTTITLQLTKDVTVNAIGDDVTVAANPDYDSLFTGDPDLVEEKFIRFSYRFKFEDNEYSLAAPYTQICFIPKHNGLFGGGQNETLQDMKNAYDSTIVEWFTNNIDTVSLKVPLPTITTSTSAQVVSNLINEYKITNIEILYKESDALSTKILESIQVDDTILPSFLQLIPQTASGLSGREWYYNFDYKSIKAFRTLPTSEQNRVYDNVPVKALAQEITANRVMYGNFLQKHTPPNGIDYEIINEDKSVNYDNYAQYPYHTVKQNRSYQAGFVLSDRYGRASSVVLSTNDSNPDLAGSTLYVPYKTFGELDDPATDVTTYKWLGNVLRLKINNGVTQITNNSQTGEPGLYKSWTDKTTDSVAVITPGTGYIVGQEISFNSGNGQGSGLEIEVVTVDGAGGVTGLSIVNSGGGYVDGQILDNNIIITGTGLQVQVTVNPPNVLGWQSYKLVVKQQEQEYYNVYLPGYISGYPVVTANDYGRIAFASLFGDNINKVPRDLNEVGPTQNEFSSSVVLIGRVNNPNINNLNKGALAPGGPFYYENRTYPWNCQYYPGRLKDEAVTIGPVGFSGLELANSPFEAGNTSSPAGSAIKGAFSNDPFKIPWGKPGAVQSFYNVEQNPLAVVVKIGAEDTQPNLTQPGAPQLNTLGARVSKQGVFPVPPAPPVGAPDPAGFIGCMYPFLSVSETEPVESLLEIFYETSTSGNFVDLNDTVLADYGGVTKASLTLGSFDEDVPSGTDIITSFDFQDSAGNTLTLDSVPIITQVLDSNGNDVTGIFSISESVPTFYDKFDLETNSLFWYGYSSVTKSNQWFVSFQTSYQTGAFIDVLSNEITIDLNNIEPTIGGFTPAQTSDLTQLGVEQACSKPGGTAGYDTTMTGVFGQFTNAKNSGADVPNETQDLCYTLSVTSEPVGSTAIWAISQDGTLSLTSGTLVNGTYIFECTVTDAASSCVLDAGSLDTTCEYELLFGTPPTNQAICAGPTSELGLLDTSCPSSFGGTGLPLEVFFGANRFVNSGIAGTAGANIGSDTTTIMSTIDTALGALGPKYGFTSSNGLNLSYYNVLQEIRYGADKTECV